MLEYSDMSVSNRMMAYRSDGRPNRFQIERLSARPRTPAASQVSRSPIATILADVHGLVSNRLWHQQNPHPRRRSLKQSRELSPGQRQRQRQR